VATGTGNHRISQLINSPEVWKLYTLSD